MDATGLEPQDCADLLVAYDWPYDEPFLELLERQLKRRGARLETVSPQGLQDALDRARQGQLQAHAYLDRASDTSPEFAPLDEWAEAHVPFHINPGEHRRRVWYKTNLHWAFIEAGIHTPYTIAIPSLHRQPALTVPHDLAALGQTFCIKPDLGGGGWGVITTARTWEDVVSARRHMPGEDLILQEFVEPDRIGGRRAWFRVFYACGQILPCWWDDQTRLFGPTVTEQERRSLGLGALWDIMRTAARIAGIGLFSTEIARVPDGRFIVVDYINDPVDLRFLPHAREGMPADAAAALAEAIAGWVVASRAQAS